jgi:hypothetical protein
VLSLAPGGEGRAPELALALLQMGLAVPGDWRMTSGYGSRMNPDGMIQNAMERWMGGWEARHRMRRYFSLIGALGGAFLTRTLQWVDVEHAPEGAVWLAIHGCTSYGSLDGHNELVIQPLQHQLARLAEAHPFLAGFVYYGLVDSLKQVVQVYDWRDAQAEYELQQNTLMGQLGIGLGGRDLGREPRTLLPAWLGLRSRVSPERARELASGSRDAWVGKAVEETALLVAAARKVDRKRTFDFPYAGFPQATASAVQLAPLDAQLADAQGDAQPTRARLGEPDGPPVLLFTFRSHDEIEGYGREAVRHTEMFEYYMRPVGKASNTVMPVVPRVCIGMNYRDPRSVQRGVAEFRRCCDVIVRATFVLDLLRRARPRTRARVQVTTN